MIDDRLLIKQVVAGDVKAFGRLVDKHHRRVVHICLSFVAQKDDAEDIAQEVFIEVYRSIKKYRGESSLSTWLYRLSVNKSLDFIRQKSRQKRGGGLVVSVDHSTLEELQISSKSLPTDNIEEEERMQLLNAAINDLPERQRVAILLSKVDGLPQQEVAEVMKTTVSSVESLLVRAKKKLREQLLKKIEEIF